MFDSRQFSFATPFVALLTLLFSHSAFANTVWVSSGKSAPVTQLTFSEPPRLSQVIGEAVKHAEASLSSQSTMAHQSDLIFWPAAGLFEKGLQAEVDAERSQVISQLQLLNERWEGDNKVAVQDLIAVLDSYQYGRRVPFTLHYDLALMGLGTDPMLNADYLLQLPARTETVSVLGAVKKTLLTDWQPRTSAAEYVQKVEPLFWYANDSTVSVIQPNGTEKTHSIAYWNRVHADLVPGSIVFVPFRRLPSEFSTLNSDIVSLLSSRMM